MLRILNIVGIGGGCFLVSAFWVGKVDGILLGCLGFSMIVVWLLGIWLYSTLFVIGKTVESVGTGIYKAGAKILEKAKEEKVFDRIGERMAAGDNVVHLPPSKKKE